MGFPRRSEVSATHQMWIHTFATLTHFLRFSNRIPGSAKWDGLEGGGKRRDQVGTFYGYQVDPVVTRREELPDQGGFEGWNPGDV